MKIKTINKVLTDKMNDFLESIEDEPLRRDVKRDMLITGGCIASLLLQEKVNDYDVYFSNVDTAIQVAAYYASRMDADIDLLLHDTDTSTPYYLDLNGADGEGLEGRGPLRISPADISYKSYPHVTRVGMFISSSGVAEETESEDFTDEVEDYVEPKKYRPIFISENAITLSDKVQLVLRFTGNPAEIHSNYDFVHATNYWTFKTGVVTNKDALEALLARELIYRGSKYPLASIFRTRKFIQRNWRIHIGNYLKMAMQLNELDLKDPHVLRDQLTGVDAAYLSGVIAAAQALPGDKLETSQLLTIIDRMMGQDDTTDEVPE